MWLPLHALLRECGMKSPWTSYALFVLLFHADTRLQSKMVEATLNHFLDHLQLTFDIILIVVYVMYSMFSIIRRLRLIETSAQLQVGYLMTGRWAGTGQVKVYVKQKTTCNRKLGVYDKIQRPLSFLRQNLTVSKRSLPQH